MNYNVIAEAVYKACAETGFEVAFTRGKYDFAVTFYAEKLGECSVARVYGEDIFKESTDVRKYPGINGEVVIICKGADEVVRYMAKMFAEFGVILEVPNETAA